MFDTLNLDYVAFLQQVLSIADLHKRFADFANLSHTDRTLNVDYGATLQQVLSIARLDQGFSDFIILANQANQFFMQGNDRAAFAIIHNLWSDPRIVPSLLLVECFYARRLALPSWTTRRPFKLMLMNKKLGGTRRVIIPDFSTRICMGAVNSMLQTTCNSWDPRTMGFRPGYGTHTAITALAEAARPILHSKGCAYFLLFDIHKAYNSVNCTHLAQTLQLQSLPHSLKALLWQWQHNRTVVNFCKTGLVQGFSYSPTLFAWYLDSVFVKHTPFIAYVDNFAGVFASEAEARLALEHAKALLHAAGLTIHPASIAISAAHSSLPSYHLEWLGHGLELPICAVEPRRYEQAEPQKVPEYISEDTWKALLEQSDWVNHVIHSNWRGFH